MGCLVMLIKVNNYFSMTIAIPTAYLFVAKTPFWSTSVYQKDASYESATKPRTSGCWHFLLCQWCLLLGGAPGCVKNCRCLREKFQRKNQRQEWKSNVKEGNGRHTFDDGKVYDGYGPRFFNDVKRPCERCLTFCC